MERVGTRGSLLGETYRHRLKHRAARVGKRRRHRPSRRWRQRQQRKGLVILRPPVALILGLG